MLSDYCACDHDTPARFVPLLCGIAVGLSAGIVVGLFIGVRIALGAMG